MQKGDVIKVREGRRSVWTVRVLAIVNAKRNLRVQRIDKDGTLKPPFTISMEKVVR